jgi:acetyl-CoA acetyltransferase
MRVYVLGLETYPPSRRVADKRLEEMVFDTTRAALDNAGVERGEIDHVTIAASDELDGRSISSMLLAMPAGAYLKDEIRCTDSGLIGFCLGALRLETGLFDLGLVVSWNKSSIAPFEDVMRMRCDPFFIRPIGLNASIADGLLAQALAHRFGFGESDATEAVVQAYGRAARNPRGLHGALPTASEIARSPYVATPLRRGHQAPVTDGAVAIVVASENWLTRHSAARPLARVAGLGWRTEAYNLGAERLSGLNGFRASFADALARAGLGGPADLDVLELDSQSGFHAVAFARALGDVDGRRINPSGGPFAQNPYFCTGLANAAEAILQVSGSGGSVQISGAATAAAHGCHGFAQQGNAVAIFESI